MARRTPSPDHSPLTDAEFAALMRPFAPFEARPVLAVAVSGGRDSRALALLAKRWASRRHGRVVALVVDHGLRAESAAEAAQTRAWLRAHAIDAHVLRWRPPQPPATGVQAAARAARYRLLLDWCRANAVLHLLTAHQADDQAETVALRAARDSGPRGLAGMSAVVEFPEARLLRPLLAVPRARLTATLQARGESWIDDPSNLDPRFARARLRREDVSRVRRATLREASRRAHQRVKDEACLAAAIARCAMPHPLGGVLIDHAAWLNLPQTLAAPVLASIVATVAGADYTPRRARLAGAAARLCAVPPRPDAPPAGQTIGGCRILWRTGGWLVVREPASIVAPTRVAGDAVRWDGRFDLGSREIKLRCVAAHAMVKPSAPGARVTRSASRNANRAVTEASDAGHEPPVAAVQRLSSLSDRRAAWASAWPATPGLPALVAALPVIIAGHVPSPTDVEGAAVEPRDASPGGANCRSGRVDRGGALRFRPGRPLAAGPFFACFALAKRQIVTEVPHARPKGRFPRPRQPDGHREPV